MRLWSLHPMYLDSKRLVALWREGLLAKKVLAGKTKGYKYHPQLHRFKHFNAELDNYLAHVYSESINRGYNFNADKLGDFTAKELPVTKGQLMYEFNHLKNKLTKPEQKQLDELIEAIGLHPHPMFYVVDGGIENWERV